MKRIAGAVLYLLMFSAVATAQEAQRYLVATKIPFKAGALAAAVRDARQTASGHVVEPRNVAGLESFDGFAADLTSSDVASLRASAAVRWIEPVIERRAFAMKPRTPNAQTVPYGIELLMAPQAWNAPRPGLINVVVIDTGIDYHHAELKSIYAGGRNVLKGNNDPFDDEGHGTHVAGTIAAANNGDGVVGVAPDIRLWSVKTLGSNGVGTTEGIIKAIDWIIEKKAALGGNWVANLSLGSSGASIGEREAFARGVAAGILFVAASGNESAFGVPAPVAYPAAYPGVLAVGAINQALEIAAFSNQGSELDVVAPGVDVLSTVITSTGSIAWAQAAGHQLVGLGLTGAKQGSVTAEYVDCGLGKNGDCPAKVAGRIAVIKRGDIRFSEKAKNAKLAGAVGVAIYNHDDSAMNWTLTPDDDPTAANYDWPIVIALAKEDGAMLVAKDLGVITITNKADDYGYKSGTSMASPHAAAAAALVWSVVPNASAAQISDALTSTAIDLGAPGVDGVFGRGIVNVVAAIRLIAPTALEPANPTPPGTRPTTGRRFLKRG